MTKKRRVTKKTRGRVSSQSSSSSMSISPGPEPRPEKASTSVAASERTSRPGSRERRTAAAVAAGQHPPASAPPSSPLPLQWSEAQRQEAIRLVREVNASGMTPGDMVRLGVDRTMMLACCRELGIQFEGSSQSSPAAAAQAEAPAVAAATVLGTPPVSSKTAKRKRRKARRPEGDLAAIPSSASSSPYSPSLNDGTYIARHGSEQDEIEGMLRRKVELQMQRAALLKLGTHQPPPETTSVDPAASLDPVTLRRAALASMKRKRNGGEATADGAPADVVQQSTLQPLSEPPSSAPRAPRAHATARYRDIDAVDVEVATLAYEAEDEGANGSANLAAGHVDDGNRRSKLLAYIDDDFHYEVSAPAGQVDYSAPLPTIVAPPPPPARSTTVSHQSSVGNVARRMPFLASPLNQIIVDFSDDESDEEDDTGMAAAKRVRNARVRTVIAAYKEQSDSVARRSRSGTPSMPAATAASTTTTTTTATNGEGTPTAPTRRAAMNDTQALLLSKEREIADLKRKVEAYAQRKAAAAAAAAAGTSSATVDERVEAGDGDGDGNGNDDHDHDGQGRSASMPDYESPFTRYPGLRKVVEEAQARETAAAAAAAAVSRPTPPAAQ